MLMSAVFGALGGAFAPKVPVVSTLPYSRAVAGAGTAYHLKKRGMKNLAIAAISGQMLGPQLGGAFGQVTGNSTGAW